MKKHLRYASAGHNNRRYTATTQTLTIPTKIPSNWSSRGRCGESYKRCWNMDSNYRNDYILDLYHYHGIDGLRYLECPGENRKREKEKEKGFLAWFFSWLKKRRWRANSIARWGRKQKNGIFRIIDDTIPTWIFWIVKWMTKCFFHFPVLASPNIIMLSLRKHFFSSHHKYFHALYSVLKGNFDQEKVINFTALNIAISIP